MLEHENPSANLLRIEGTARESALLNSMKLYYHLNNIGELETNWQLKYQVEKIDEQWPTIASMVGVPGAELPKPPSNINTRKEAGYEYMDLTWADIWAEHRGYGKAIATMASRWGYMEDDEERE